MKKSSIESQTRIFMFAAAFMVAHQIAGKALRDGIFLSQFPSTDLPKIAAAAALVSIAIGLTITRLISKFGPPRVVAGALAIGGALHLTEYYLLSLGTTAGTASLRSAVAALIYLHVVGLGAAVLSGFWSIAGEYYTPHEARAYFGRIAGMGTLGGIAGGVVAERWTAYFGVDGLLLPLAVFHLTCAAVIWRMRDAPSTSASDDAPVSTWEGARNALKQAPFLKNLAVLVLVGTMSAMLLDFLFKTEATRVFGKGPNLTRYFAAFYTITQVLSFLAQTFVAPPVLRRFGLGRTVMCHPLAIALGAGASLFAPVFLMMPIARGLEQVLRGSLFRSGYEIFFTPIPPKEKRAIKTFIDVACDRLGDAMGATLVQLLLLFGPQQAPMPVLATTITLAGIGVWITLRMDKAYAGVLEHGLLTRAVEIDESEAQDATTLSAIWHSGIINQVPRQPMSLAQAAGNSETHGDKLPAAPVRPADPWALQLAELRSAVPSRVLAALEPTRPFDPLLGPQLIRLLAWNEVCHSARAYLIIHAHQMIGQLTDALLDPEGDLAIRRRIPRVLAYSNSQRAVAGLVEALGDARFEVRFNVSRALDFLLQVNPALHVDSAVIMSTVEKELSVSRPIWTGRRLLDRREDSDPQYSYLDDVLRDRANWSLEHIFSLLALVLPREPLKVAFRALHSADRLLQGLALEYLETNLPPKMFRQLRELTDGPMIQASQKEPEEALEALMASQQSVLDSLKIASAGARERAGTLPIATPE